MLYLLRNLYDDDGNFIGTRDTMHLVLEIEEGKDIEQIRNWTGNNVLVHIHSIGQEFLTNSLAMSNL